MSRPSSCAVRFVAVALMSGLAASAAAAAQEPAPSGQTTASERRIRDGVLAQYRVLPVQNGIILVPLSRIDGVDNIELRGGTIAINGHPVTGGEVRDRLGRGADVVLELSYLGLPAQQRILIPGTGPAGPRAPAAPAPPPAVPGVVVLPVPEVPDVPEPPAPPFRDRSFPDRTFNREMEARVRVGGGITVAEDERVTGAVVAVAGSVTVNGRVQDDVVAVGGNVRLGRRAEVGGDVVVVGGTIEREPGAVVRGKVSEVAFAIPGVHIRPNWRSWSFPWFDSGPWRAFRLFASLVRMALFALLATLVLLLAPKAVQRVQVAVTTQFWKSALVGLLAQLFFVPVLVLAVVVLAVSIIGIPLLVLVPFVVLAFFVALLLGLTGAASGLGRLVQRGSSSATPTGFALLAIGLAMIWGITVLGRLVGLGGGPLAYIGTLVVLTGFVIEYAAWSVGLGGALLTRFGRRGPLTDTVPPIPSTSGDPFAGDAELPLPPV
jgi:hypothetical protein